MEIKGSAQSIRNFKGFVVGNSDRLRVLIESVEKTVQQSVILCQERYRDWLAVVNVLESEIANASDPDQRPRLEDELRFASSAMFNARSVRDEVEAFYTLIVTWRQQSVVQIETFSSTAVPFLSDQLAYFEAVEGRQSQTPNIRQDFFGGKAPHSRSTFVRAKQLALKYYYMNPDSGSAQRGEMFTDIRRRGSGKLLRNPKGVVWAHTVPGVHTRWNMLPKDEATNQDKVDLARELGDPVFERYR